jgi:hypothetical protein
VNDSHHLLSEARLQSLPARETLARQLQLAKAAAVPVLIAFLCCWFSCWLYHADSHTWVYLSRKSQIGHFPTTYSSSQASTYSPGLCTFHDRRWPPSQRTRSSTRSQQLLPACSLPTSRVTYRHAHQLQSLFSLLVRPQSAKAAKRSRSRPAPRSRRPLWQAWQGPLAMVLPATPCLVQTSL